MPNCSTTQKTLTKLEFLQFFFTCNFYNTYNNTDINIIQHFTHNLMQISSGWHGWRTILVFYLIKLAWLFNLIHSVYTKPNEDNYCVPMWRDCLPFLYYFYGAFNFFFFFKFYYTFNYWLSSFYFLFLFIHSLNNFLLYQKHLNIDLFTLLAVYSIPLDSCLVASAHPRLESSLVTAPHIEINCPWKDMEGHN